MDHDSPAAIWVDARILLIRERQSKSKFKAYGPWGGRAGDSPAPGYGSNLRNTTSPSRIDPGKEYVIVGAIEALDSGRWRPGFRAGLWLGLDQAGIRSYSFQRCNAVHPAPVGHGSLTS